jgi:hypothetical protein
MPDIVNVPVENVTGFIPSPTTTFDPAPETVQVAVILAVALF